MIKERILLVEDNKALSKLIRKKMEQNLNYEIIQAYSYKEAEEILEDNDDFFVALLDLNLPDAPNGEIVDFVLSYEIPSIVLTGTIDSGIRDEITSKNIIDYVYKGNMDDVNYIFSLIKRLSKNRDIKVMVVDDSQVARNKIKKILQKHMFKVIVAAHGEEALNYLEDNPDIELILTDYNMPVINGIELTKEVRKKYDKNQIIIISVTSSSEQLISAKFLKIGANDFINKPFSDEELICRVNNTLEAKEYLAKMTDMAHIDFLTGLYNRRHFFEQIDEFIKNSNEFAVAMIDIDHFKKINDKYGHDAGDMVLKNISDILKKSIKGSDIAARFGGEEFCIALQDISKKDAIGFFIKLKEIISKNKMIIKGDKINCTVSIGVSFGEKDDDINTLLNNADQALYRAKENGRNRVEIA